MTRSLPRPLMPLMTSAVALAVLGLTSAAAEANNRWDKRKGDCDDTAFAEPADTPLKKVVKCVYTWATYTPDLRRVSGAYREKVIAAISRVYVEGDAEDEVVAEKELRKLGIKEMPDKTAQAPRTPPPPPRERFTAPEPSKKDIAAAERHFRTGFGHARKKKHDAALAAYLKMIDVAPGYAKGHYNVACIYALLEDDDNMVKYLQNLQDLAFAGDEEADKMIKMTWAHLDGKAPDSDFDGMRDLSEGFKRVTGYAKIRIINTIPDLDEDNPFHIEKSLQALGYRPESTDSNNKTHDHPLVYYAPHAVAAAFVVRSLIGHPKVKSEEHDAESLGGFDVIVRWSDDIKKVQTKTWVKDPRDAERELNDLSRKQDAILREPEKVAWEVEDTLDRPARAQRDIQRTLDRPGQAIDRTKQTLDRIKRPFK